jgi:hypothetical protein
MSQAILIAALILPSIMVTVPTLPSVVKCHLGDSMTPMTFRFPSSVTIIPTVGLVYRQEQSQSSSKMLCSPHTLFLIILMKGIYFAPFQCG